MCGHGGGSFADRSYPTTCQASDVPMGQRDDAANAFEDMLLGRTDCRATGTPSMGGECQELVMVVPSGTPRLWIVESRPEVVQRVILYEY